MQISLRAAKTVLCKWVQSSCVTLHHAAMIWTSDEVINAEQVKLVTGSAILQVVQGTPLCVSAKVACNPLRLNLVRNQGSACIPILPLHAPLRFAS